MRQVLRKYGAICSFVGVLLILACLAVWIDLGKIQKNQSADSIVPVLVSLYKWTPFYWEQNRIGMLLPLLALPFKHPLTNMLVQYGLAAWLGLSAFFLGARCVVGKGPWIAVGVIGAIICLVFGSDSIAFHILMGQHQYTTSLTMGFAGILLLDRAAVRKHWIAAAFGVFLLLLASWVNMALIASLLPFIVVRNTISRERNKPIAGSANTQGHLPVWRRIKSAFAGPTTWTIAAILAAFGAIFVLSRIVLYPIPYKMLPLGQWGYTGIRLWQDFCAVFPVSGWVAGACLLGLALASADVGKSRWATLLSGMKAAAPFAAAAMGNCVAMSALKWTQMNTYSFRYLIPTVIFVFLAIGAFSCVIIIRGSGGWTRAANGLAMAVFIGAMLVTFGWPSQAGVRADIDNKMGSFTQDVSQAKCTHIMGNYWRVWPAVFHANLVNFERGDHNIIWGIALRCDPTRKLWMKVPLSEMRIASLIGDDDDISWLTTTYRLWPLTQEMRLPTICVLRPVVIPTTTACSAKTGQN